MQCMRSKLGCFIDYTNNYLKQLCQLQNHKKEKHSSTRKEMIQSKSTTILMWIKSLQGVETTQTSSHSLENWGDLSLLSSLLYDMKHTHTWQKWKPKVKGVGEGSRLALSHSSPMVLFICENRRVECPGGLKWKLLLLKGSLVWPQLCCTGLNQTNCLLLLFHMTSVMMPRALSVITPPPVLRQN
jgi:hypothetical protein